MRGICRLCWRKITVAQSSHLRREHGIDSSYKDAIEDYFLQPEELGISRQDFDKLPEGAEIKVEHPRVVYLLNSPIITSYGLYRYRPLSIGEAKAILSEAGFISAIGHKGTADFLSTLLDIIIPINRVRVTMQPGDIAVVFRVLQRLPEGKVLSAEDLKSIPYEFGLLRMIE